jgi:uncharacterized protein (DUF2342 family)
MPAYVGPKGWVALRLGSGEIDWDEVAELVSDSYRRIAPKHLASQGQTFDVGLQASTGAACISKGFRGLH